MTIKVHASVKYWVAIAVFIDIYSKTRKKYYGSSKIYR